jgi:5-methyltetrahydrofolate--homocysteine methyltransferase
MTEALRHLCRVDPVMAQLIERAGPYAPKPERGVGAYEALVQAVAHQQLTARAANTILGRFYALYDGGGCPEPARLVATPDAQLRACGFSRAKTAALKDIAARALDGTIPPRRALARMKDAAIIARLVEARGVGRWTAEMFLMFTLARPDVLPVDDYGIQNGFRIAYGNAGCRSRGSSRSSASAGRRSGPRRRGICGERSTCTAAPAPAKQRRPDMTGRHPDRLMEMLVRRAIVLGDGAMGTMLQFAGLTEGAPERWNVERPEVVKSVHRAYVEAGSDFISTNTFGGTRNRLALDGLADRVAELNEAGARLAREAAGERLVAGSMGPTGELMEPLGILTPSGARESFAEQARALAAGGADFALIETMSALEEVQAAIEGAREAELPVAVTMSFDTNFHTMMGVKPARAVATLSEWGVGVIGANCGNGPAEIERIMTEMSQAKPEGVFLMAKSNAGMPRWKDDRITYGGTPEVMADYARKMVALGVHIVGGCCGSTPEHVASMRRAVDGLT